MKYLLPLCLFAGFLAHGSTALATTAVIPVSFDYELLRSLLVQRHFTDDDQTAVVLNEEGGCRKVVLSNPRLTPLGWALRTTADVSVRTGVVVMDKCISPDEWKGVIDIDQRMEIEPGTARLRFVTIESYVHGRMGQSSTLGSLLYSILKERAHQRLDHFAIDLTPILNDLRSGLLEFVPSEKQDRARVILNKARPLKARADDDFLRLSFLVETPSVVSPPPPVPLTDEERERFVTLWETWDEYLVTSALALSDISLSLEERQELLGLLLDSRSAFDEALTSDHLDRDLVRDQFIASWRMLSPLMRRGLAGAKALAKRGPESILAMTPFFSANEALTALDRLGPVLGVEISVEGLIHLARLMNAEETFSLRYDNTVRPDLRKTLGLEEETKAPGGLQAPHSFNHPGEYLWSLLVPRVLAAERSEPGKPQLEEVALWIQERHERNDYLKRARGLLAQKRDEPARINKVPESRRPWFGQLIEATAWQESCFSQFKQVGDDVSYLRSYNGSSVGLMQINERVWRGLYAIPSLRWEIDYNVGAGIDILALYLNQFALPKAKKKKLDLSPDELAGVMYAMYNGGPSQFSKFLRRMKKGKLYTTDRLFAEKYGRVVKGEWGKVKGCYRRM